MHTRSRHRAPRHLGGALGFCLLLASSLLLARTLTVDDDGPADFRSIQQAIDAALPGDLVSVASGTYSENLALRCGVGVIGAGSGTTTIDGGRRGSVATIVACDASTRLQGFRLTDGRADQGAGILVQEGSPVITLNLITGNSAVASGAAYYSYGGGIALLNSAALVEDNQVSGNTADYGGGIQITGGSPRLTRNLITGNSAAESGGGIDAYVVYGSAPLIAANVLQGNSTSYGGGMELIGAGTPVVTNNLVIGNTAIISGGLAGYGGGIDSYFVVPSLTNNTIAGNQSEYGGGLSVVAYPSDEPTLANNVVYGNTATTSGGGADVDADGMQLVNNLFFLNGPDACSGLSAPLCSGPTNLFSDPLLVDPAGSDYRLRSGSPGIDTGTPAGAPPDDLRGQRRPLDGDRDGAAAVDRGAYEYDRNDVLGLAFSGSATMAWKAVSGAGSYHPYSGRLSTLRLRGVDACRDADDPNGSDLTFADAQNPPVGDGFAYLVTAVVAGAEQSPGFDSRGIERTLPLPCP
jgi:hypothetical protein